MTNEIDVIERLKAISLSGDLEGLDEYAKGYQEHCDHVQEVCRLLHNIANSNSLQIISRNTELLVSVFGPQIINACKTLTTHPNSKIAKDNLDAFLDFWISLWNDIHQLTKDLRDAVIALDNYYYSPSTHPRRGRSPKSESMQSSSPMVPHPYHASPSSHHQASSLNKYGQEVPGSGNDSSPYKPPSKYQDYGYLCRSRLRPTGQPVGTRAEPRTRPADLIMSDEPSDELRFEASVDSR